MRIPEKLKKIAGGGNAVALGVFEMDDGSSATVERDASGVPVAWRIFKLGANEMTRGGESWTIEFSDEMLDMIVAYYAEKGEKIPLDSEHFLYALAEKLKVPESEVARMLQKGTGTFGFAALEKRPDGLWVRDVEYLPLAKELIAEKIYRFFSPVLRGLSDGRLRVTSVAFINSPALNNLDAIAASAESTSVSSIFGNIAVNQQKEKGVNKILARLAGLLGMDSISLGADGSMPQGVEEKIDSVETELGALRQTKQGLDKFLGSVRDSLALGAEGGLDVAEGKIIALSQKAANADQLKSRVDALELSAETDRKTRLIEQGQKDGKLAGGLLEWAKKLDSVALGAFLGSAPVIVPSGVIPRQNLTEGDSVALTAEDRAVCKRHGLSEEEFLKTKKEDAKAAA